MPTLAQRALMARLNQAAHGVDITVTPPGLAAVTTTGIWHEPLDDPQPYGTNYRKTEPRRVMEIPRSSTLNDIPDGSIVRAVDVDGGSAKNWKVEGLDRPNDPLRIFVRLRVTT
jgi:hypothetical protein